MTFVAVGARATVRDATPRVRLALPRRRVLALLDGDRRDDADEPNGVFLTPRCHLENYVLEPAGWAGVSRRLRSAAPGWGSPSELQETLRSAFREVVPLAAKRIAKADAGPAYEQARATVEAQEAAWPVLMPGKDVLRRLLRTHPILSRSAWGPVVAVHYFEACPAPPDDLLDLVDRMLKSRP